MAGLRGAASWPSQNLDQIKLSVRLSCLKLSVGAVLPRRNLEQTEAGFLADRKAHANLDKKKRADRRGQP